jgi:hypothetical protein
VRMGIYCDCCGNDGHIIPLDYYRRTSYIEGALFMKSVLSSEPLGDKDLSDRFNFYSNINSNASFVAEPTPDTDSISSDNSSSINTQVFIVLTSDMSSDLNGYERGMVMG